MLLFTNVLLSFFSIGFGLWYTFNVYGMANDAASGTAMWGWMAVCLGIINLLIIFVSSVSKKPLHILKLVSISLNGLIQWVPVVFWIVFDSEIVGEHGEKFVGKWLYSIPHILIIILGFVCIIQILKQRKNL